MREQPDLSKWRQVLHLTDPPSIPIARVEIELPYGEPYDWNELNTQERENVVEWQHQVKRWKGRILARRLA